MKVLSTYIDNNLFPFVHNFTDIYDFNKMRIYPNNGVFRHVSPYIFSGYPFPNIIFFQNVFELVVIPTMNVPIKSTSK